MEPSVARALLATERERTEGRLGRLLAEHDGFVDASRDTNADDEHDPEGATIAFERSQVGALARQARDHLAAVEAAARRLDEGTFGRCVACGRAIPDERLEARPTALTCVTCSAATAARG